MWLHFHIVLYPSEVSFVQHCKSGATWGWKTTNLVVETFNLPVFDDPQRNRRQMSLGPCRHMPFGVGRVHDHD